VKIDRDDLSVARVLHEDDDFITLEVGKRDDASWHVAPVADEPEKPQQFYTILFVTQDSGYPGEPYAKVWKPWEEEADA
jgi:hypothetical protein